MNMDTIINKLHLDRKKLLAIGIAILCVALVVTIVILGFPHKTAPINHFCKAMQKGSIEEFERCMPTEAWAYAEQQYDPEGTKKVTLHDEMTLLVLQTNAALDERFGKKLKVSFHVTEMRVYDNESLRKLAQTLNDKFNLNPEEITEACEFVVDTVTKGGKGKQTQEGDLYIVYKYHEQWYLYFDPLNAIS